jgi:L-ascorbate metabolism protein UlaG (beta-lactamase superfamily)
MVAGGVEGGDHVLYLGGDSGYRSHFKTIGERFGPMDLAILECGQYGKDWPAIHMLPEECMAAARELRARVLLPVHWGKFSLSLHPWDEPIRRVLKAGGEEDLGEKDPGAEDPVADEPVIATPMIGEPMILGRPVPRKAWWEGVVK